MDNQLKIYISYNRTEKDYRQKIEAAEYNIRNIGAIPISPLKLGIPSGITYTEAQQYYQRAIEQCHAVFMLENYDACPAALDEFDFANSIHREIFYEKSEGYKTLADVIRLNIIAAGY